MEARAVPGWTWPRDGASLFLAVLLGLVAGCGRGHDTAPAASARRIAVIGAMAPAGRTAPVLPEPGAALEDSASTTAYASLEAVRDTVVLILRHAVDLADTAVHVSRDTLTFRYLYAAALVKGWAVRVAVNDTSACPVERLESALLARGWVMHWGYGADGPDGTMLGLVSRDYLCVVEGRWDGGDDSDSTVVPIPGCVVIATCVPRRKDDVPR